MAKFIDLTGQKFGRLVVISRAESNKWGASRWNCLCDCGNEKIVRGVDLNSGHTQSCGCYNIEKVKEASTKHGHNKVGNVSPTYQCWSHLIQRCTNPNDKRYTDYGGRGITVCDRWLNSFENFLEDMEERPKGMSIDRIDNNGNYCKENCKWSTGKEQGGNKRTNVWLIFNGETKIRGDWAKEWKIGPTSLKQHLSKGHSMEWIYENKVEPKLTKNIVRSRMMLIP